MDWFHAKQHLAEAARLYKGEGTAAYTLWLNSRETALYPGLADKIACELEQAAVTHPPAAEGLVREAGYFHQHARRMNYLELREEAPSATKPGSVDRACAGAARGPSI